MPAQSNTAQHSRSSPRFMTEIISPFNIAVEMVSPGALLVKLSADSRAHNQPLQASVGVVREALHQSTKARLLSFESAGMSGWDSRFVAFIRNCADICRTQNVELRDDGLPEGVRRLLRLAQAVPKRTEASRETINPGVLQRMGERATRLWDGTKEMLAFLGEDLLA